MANIQDLENSPNAKYLNLLNLFAYGTYKSLAESAGSLPELTSLMTRKLRLLTVVSLAEQNKLLPYNLLMSELDITTVRELEDLVIEGISAGVVLGKLDQKSSCFEVDFVIGRDIRKIDISSIVGVLSAWCENCDSMLSNIETQVDKVNKEKSDTIKHKAALDQKINDVKQRIKNQTGEEGDPDSRMETENRREKKGSKGSKGMRSSNKSGAPSGSFWNKQ